MTSRLLQHLIARGLVSRGQAESVAQRQASHSGGSIDTATLELGILNESTLLAELGEVSGFRPVNLLDFEPNPDVAPLIPAKIADRLGIVPLSLDGVILHLASCDPVPKRELDEVGLLLGKSLEIWVAIEARVRDWIATVYGSALAPRYAQLLASLEQPVLAPPELESEADSGAPEAQDGMTRAMVEQLAQGVASEPVRAMASTEDDGEFVIDLVNRKSPPAAAPVANQRPAQPSHAPHASSQPNAYATQVSQPARAAAPASQPHVSHSNVSQSNAYAAHSAQTSRAAAQAPHASQPHATQPQSHVSQPNPHPTQSAQAPRAIAPAPQPNALQPAPASRVAAAQPNEARQTSATAQHPQATPAQLRTTAPPPASSASSGAARPEVPTRAAIPPVSTVRIDAHGYQAYAREAQGEHAPPRRTPTQVPIPSAVIDGAQDPRGVVTVPGVPAITRAQPAVEAPRRRTEPEFRPAPARESQFLVFPSPDAQPAASFPTPRAVRTPAPHFDEAVVDWTLTQARAALREASRDRDRLLDVALRFARRTFDFVAAFGVVRGAAAGFTARGDGAEASRITEINIPLDASSVFRTVAMTRGSYVGPLPPDALSLRYLQTFGRAPRTVFLFPIEVKTRLVAILYGDSGGKPVSQRRLSDLLLFCQDLPSAFQELIHFRKQQSDLKLPDVDPPEKAELSRPVGSWTGGWSPFATPPSAGPGRTASVAAFIQVDASRPPPDFGAVLRRLTGPDAALRAHAMAELARSPEASARVLSQAFPGPSGWSRLPVNELPEADELGPIPAAISRLGRAGAQALVPLLDSDDGDARYFALLTAGNLPYAELVSGILRGLFDYEPDISSAARAAATAFKRLPRFDAAMRDLRQELAARDALRRSLAARALGTLHDRDSVEGLIGLTASDDPMCAQAAADALREITRATHGVDTRAWTRWWAENRTRRRAEWLVAALRHPELELRLAASDELTRATSDPLGFRADAPLPERELSVKRWEAALSDSFKLRRLALL